MGVLRVPASVLALILATCLAVTALAGCGGSQTSSSTSRSVAGPRHALRNRACDRNPLNGVHGPDRLKVLSACAAFQGTVNEAPTKNPDGDVSFSVSPDPGYARMLNSHNRSEGGLHIEIVPRDRPGCTRGQRIHSGDVPNLGTCSGRNVRAPSLGAHVRIVGAWVLDRNNDWYEIHPAWRIKILHP
jgi:hypothetical protein